VQKNFRTYFLFSFGQFTVHTHISYPFTQWRPQAHNNDMKS